MGAEPPVKPFGHCSRELGCFIGKDVLGDVNFRRIYQKVGWIPKVFFKDGASVHSLLKMVDLSIEFN